MGVSVKPGFAHHAALLLAMLFTGAQAHATEMAMRVFRINDHLLCFYDGRPDQATVKPGAADWADAGANYVGVATYVIYRGDHALVYDSFPSVKQAKWVRDYLEKAGIHHFALVNSHWHLDHVGGNAVYWDSFQYATEKTRQILAAKKAAIEAGTEWGAPAIKPLSIPELGISQNTTYAVEDIRVEMRPVNIHSEDGLVLYLPDDQILLAGDTLEDTVTFISEPERIPEQYRNLLAMKQWGFTRILPNHGNPDVIAKGGYTTTLIDVTRAYLRRMVEHSHDPDYLDQPLENYMSGPLARGEVSLWWAYHDAHKANLSKVAQAWKNRPLPDFGPAN
jgi:glyoxylase-like metal-dependent hydrolase (beta-lactamase superfamily II)